MTDTALADVVRTWLDTKTWDASFDVLTAAQESLVSQDGLDAVVEIADEDDRSVHAAIIQALAGGFSMDFVKLLVTNRDAARDIARQALANGHEPVVRVVLALNTPLGASDEGAAIFLASGLRAGALDEVLASCVAAAAEAPEGSARVAAHLEALAADDLVPQEHLADVLQVLQGDHN